MSLKWKPKKGQDERESFDGASVDEEEEDDDEVDG